MEDKQVKIKTDYQRQQIGIEFSKKFSGLKRAWLYFICRVNVLLRRHQDGQTRTDRINRYPLRCLHQAERRLFVR